MSLRRRVVELIEEYGPSSATDLAPYLDEYTVKQIIGGLQAAAENGWVHCKGRARRPGMGKGSAIPATYYLGPSESKAAKLKEKTKQCRDIIVRPPSSVWELGHGRQIAGTWPPIGQGRRLEPLGDWPDYQPRSAA